MKCRLRGRTPELRRRSPCDGGIHRHHVIPKQLLRREWELARERGEGPLLKVGITALLADERNLMPLCPRHHSQITLGFKRIAEWQMPKGIRDFAAEYGLEWALERELSKFR